MSRAAEAWARRKAQQQQKLANLRSVVPSRVDNFLSRGNVPPPPLAPYAYQQYSQYPPQQQQQQMIGIPFIGYGGLIPQETTNAAIVEDDPSWRQSKKLQMYGNQQTYNLNSLLANCIQSHAYTQRLLELGDSFQLLLNEAKEKISHLEPWAKGIQRMPSTAFCILFRLFQIGLHRGHVETLLAQSSAYVRCLAYLYLRYVCHPSDLWNWCEIGLKEDVDDKLILCGDTASTVANWLQSLLTDQKYYGTILPRIPIKIEREIKVKLILLEESRNRAKINTTKLHCFLPGTKVRAIYADQETEPAFFDAQIDRQDNKSKVPKFFVTFTEYGNQELVWIGEIELIGDNFEKIPHKKNQSVDGDPIPAEKSSHIATSTDHDSYQQIRRRQSSDNSDSSKHYHSDRHYCYDRSRSPSYSSSDNERSYDRHYHHRSRDKESYSRRQNRRDDYDGPRTGESLLAGDRLERVIRQQREAATSRTDYARRPQGFKEALALKLDTHHRRRRSPERAFSSTKKHKYA